MKHLMRVQLDKMADFMLDPFALKEPRQLETNYMCGSSPVVSHQEEILK